MKGLIWLIGAVVVMFWNVENFFDPFDDPLTRDDEFTPGGAKHWTWRSFERKRNGIGKTILACGDRYGSLPAIVGLAEVENSMVVRQLCRRSPLAACGEDEWGYVHRESPDARGIDVALLYRRSAFRVVAVDSLRVSAFATRDILYVKGVVLGDGGDTLHIFVNHWPSQLGGRSASSGRRAAASSVLASALDSLITRDSLARIIVMGDFNTSSPSVSLPIPASCPTPFGHLQSSHPIPGTIKYRGVWEKIDHFFVSPSLSDVSHEEIFAPNFLLEEDKTYLGVKPKRTFIGPRHNAGLSDHLPIVLILDGK